MNRVLDNIKRFLGVLRRNIPLAFYNLISYVEVG